MKQRLWARLLRFEGSGTHWWDRELWPGSIDFVEIAFFGGFILILLGIAAVFLAP